VYWPGGTESAGKCRIKGRGRVSKIAAAVFGLVISWPGEGIAGAFPGAK